MKESYWPAVTIIGMYFLFILLLVGGSPNNDKVMCPLCNEEAALINLDVTDETIKHQYAGPCGSLISVEKSNVKD